MSGTYTQIYLHFIFNVDGKENLIHNSFSGEVCKYITGTVQGFSYGHKMIRINCVPDHIHMLVGFRPVQSISDFVRDVKKPASKFINRQSWMKFHFSWMEGYGCFSIGRQGITDICNYIDKQREHHQRISFEEEYSNLLRKYDIVYKPEYFLI
ncbi:transposase [Bacteroidota bacterium]